MEMEHINENTVLIRVANQDLIDRGITITDLFTNPTQVEPFFHGLLEELDLLEFFTETEAITFQVMPNPEGLEIYVSESMHIKPSTGKDDDEDDIDDELVQRLKEVVDNDAINIMDLVDSGIFTNQEDSEVDEEDDDIEGEKLYPQEIEKVVIFSDFEDLILLAKTLKKAKVETALFEHRDRYFLSVHIDGNNKRKEDILAIILEYGEESTINKLVLQEYGKSIMPEAALETIRKHFK